MLGKLIKHEFKATSKVIVPLYGAAAAVFVLTKVMIAINGLFQKNTDAIVWGISDIGSIITTTISQILTAISVMTMVGTIVVTVILVITRFYKNMLGNEGYLMFTLPVTSSQHILSKLIVGISWTVCSALIVVFSAVVLFFNIGDLCRFIEKIFVSDIGGVFTIPFLLMVVFLLLISVCSAYLMLYLSMSIGARFGDNRLGYSVLSYVIINMSLQFIMMIGMSLIFIFSNLFVDLSQIEAWMTADMNMLPMGIVGFLCVFYAIMSGVFFAVTQRQLSKRLNLS